MDSKKRKKLLKVILGIAGIILLGSCYGHVGGVEVNNPWMIVNPPHSGFGAPYADRADPNVLYVAYIGIGGEALRIDLINKKVTPYRFNVEKYEDIDKFANKFEPGLDQHTGDFMLDKDLPWNPGRQEFRGWAFSRPTLHMFGFPVATEPGIRKITYAFGRWVLVDHQGDEKAELVRYHMWNMEKEYFGFNSNDFDISPDGKWATYRLPHGLQPIFIFKRDSKDGSVSHWRDAQ
jgi:hypothetical protein